jgi:hypothetical protein
MAELSEAVAAAYAGAELDVERNEALIAAALGGKLLAGDPLGGEADGWPSDEERAVAERWSADWDASRHDDRSAAPSPASSEAAALRELAASLIAAQRPSELDPTRSEALLARALAPSPAPNLTAVGSRQALSSAGEPRGARIIRLRFGLAVAGALALAAGFALVVQVEESPREALTLDGSRASDASSEDRVASRSTAPLFNAAFVLGENTARLDRITEQRARDLRRNRFAHWGVR